MQNMNRFTLALMGVALLGAAACGPRPGPEPSYPPSSPTAVTESPQGPASPAGSPAAPGSPMAGSPSPGAASPQAGSPGPGGSPVAETSPGAQPPGASLPATQLGITITDNGVQPDQPEVALGKTVTFKVTNKSKTAATLRVEGLNKDLKSIPPGETRELPLQNLGPGLLRLSVPEMAGKPDFMKEVTVIAPRGR